MTVDQFALVAHFLNGRSYFHGSNLLGGLQPPVQGRFATAGLRAVRNRRILCAHGSHIHNYLYR